MNKTFRWIIGLVVVLVLIVWGYSAMKGPSVPVSTEPIKIGAIYPLTGIYASYGTEYKRGLEMAIDEINIKGGINGQKLQAIIEDDGGDTTKSVTAANKLINIDGVKYLFTAFSNTSQATAPIAENNKVLNIVATVSKIGTGNYVFRDFWDIGNQGEAIGKAMTKENIKSLSILAMNYGDTEYFINSLKKTATNISIQEERFNFGDVDFKTQLTKIKNNNPDAILIYAFPGAEAMKITQQIKDLKLDGKRLFAGATTYGLPFMYQQFSETLSKMKTIDTWYSLDSNNLKSKDFAEKYKNKYSQDLVGDAAYPYDDLYALKQAIEEVGPTDILKVANELRNIKMDGVAGKLSFDKDGNSQRSAYLQIFTENGWQKYNQ